MDVPVAIAALVLVGYYPQAPFELQCTPLALRQPSDALGSAKLARQACDNPRSPAMCRVVGSKTAAKELTKDRLVASKKRPRKNVCGEFGLSYLLGAAMSGQERRP